MNKLYYIPIGIFLLILINLIVNPSGIQSLKGFRTPFKKDEFNSTHGVTNDK